jgi:hypothetical protein
LSKKRNGMKLLAWKSAKCRRQLKLLLPVAQALVKIGNISLPLFFCCKWHLLFDYFFVSQALMLRTYWNWNPIQMSTAGCEMNIGEAKDNIAVPSAPHVVTSHNFPRKNQIPLIKVHASRCYSLTPCWIRGPFKWAIDAHRWIIRGVRIIWLFFSSLVFSSNSLKGYFTNWAIWSGTLKIACDYFSIHPMIYLCSFYPITTKSINSPWQ